MADPQATPIETSTPTPTSNKRPKKPSQRSSNPLVAGITNYLTSPNHPTTTNNNNVPPPSLLPKRYTLYPPLLLLPINFPSASPVWSTIYDSLSSAQKCDLFMHIAAAFSAAGQQVTHIAINAPIDRSNADESRTLNVVRSPSGLVPVLGDWGPEELLGGVAGHDSSLEGLPTKEEFEQAFWVSTTQDLGVWQVWAPRWTMFSLGNLSEKRRVLGVGNGGFEGGYGRDLLWGCGEEEMRRMRVLDLYVGIGYFALCYLKRGVQQVWGWDLNAWSVEGLRRGCWENGWWCMVVEVDDEGELVSPTVEELVTLLGGRVGGERGSLEYPRCIAFRGDNKWAVKVAEDVQREADNRSDVGREACTRFDHVNLGLLPNSSDSWPQAVDLVADSGYLHIHTCAGSLEVAQASEDCAARLGLLLRQHGPGLEAQVVHVEQVKTYAPGVVHCVFDVQINKNS